MIAKQFTLLFFGYRIFKYSEKQLIYNGYSENNFNSPTYLYYKTACILSHSCVSTVFKRIVITLKIIHTVHLFLRPSILIGSNYTYFGIFHLAITFPSRFAGGLIILCAHGTYLNYLIR